MSVRIFYGVGIMNTVNKQTFFFFIRALSMGAVTIPTGALYHRIYPIWADVADITTTGMK